MKVRTDGGFTLIELLIVVAIISVIAAVAAPGLMRMRMTGNEASAITSLAATRAAQVSYSAACGNGGFATSYLILGMPVGTGQGFITADLGSSVTPSKSGYNFTMTEGAAGITPGVTDCHPTPNPVGAGFYATAVPTSPGTTGTRAFAVNANMTLYQDTSGTPPPEPLTIGGTVTTVQ